jgi:hypothetical protein
MVALQVALTLLILSAAGAASKGFLRLVKTDLGVRPAPNHVPAHPDP